MEEIKVINGVAYVKARLQPKNKLQALQAPVAYWKSPVINKYHYTGRSTGFILKLIGNAMLQPNVPLNIQQELFEDHYCTHVQTYVLDAIDDVINKLGLQFFVLNRANKTLSYNVLFD